MNELNKINVFYHNKKVGTIINNKEVNGAFKYSEEWLTKGFSISPFSLPLENKIFVPKKEPFDGMFGVFNDSLPDGWGRLLVDRLMLKNHLDPNSISNLNRLGIVGESGLGALTYRPVIDLETKEDNLSLDEIATECSNVLKAKYTDNLDELVLLGGSSGGARPKIMTSINNEDWIIKFPSSYDDINIGKIEYDYNSCAKECGIEVSEFKLFASNKCLGYFGTKRFDRVIIDGTINRKHMLSVSALLETSHRIPNLDYELLMKLVYTLTKDMIECKKLYRLMCFNVFAHNRDDHSKNFTFLYDENTKNWRLSPAYDLTYSNSINGEHATTIHGNGVNPSDDDLLEVAKYIGINQKEAIIIKNEVKECVNLRLSKYINKA